MWWIQWKVVFSLQYENYCQGQLCYEFIIIKPEMLCFIYCFLPKVLPFFMNINHPWSSWPISIWEEKICFTPVILNWPVLVVEGKRLKKASTLNKKFRSSLLQCSNKLMNACRHDPKASLHVWLVDAERLEVECLENIPHCLYHSSRWWECKKIIWLECIALIKWRQEGKSNWNMVGMF